jgi:hypothetical protein
LQAIEGRYAHFDVVAYEDMSTDTPMRTFIISYGFTDYRVVEDRLIQIDRFLQANYHLNQAMVSTSFSNDAVQAIQPRIKEVELTKEGDYWKIYRPASPFLLGINGNPAQALPTDSNDPNLTDPDEDGKPGVTVKITIAGFIEGEIYITRREIYENYLTLHPDRRLIGHVVDSSEQFVIDANMDILKQESNNSQVSDPGLNPIILTPIDARIDTFEDLPELDDNLFPEEPRFF